MSFSLILFQRKTLQLIGQNLITLKKYLLLRAAGCQDHLYFCVISMGFHNLLNDIVLKKKKNIFVSDLKSTSIFLLVICCRESNLFRREFIINCPKINLLMFLWRKFSKALLGSKRAPLLRFYEISCGSLKIESSHTYLWIVRKRI